MIIGIDPGNIIGLVTIADEKMIDKLNCLSIQEMDNKIKSILKNVNLSITNVKIRIGNGVPVYKDLIEVLDNTLSPEIVLELVSERGTNLPLNKRNRYLRHITSAARISTREGQIYQRREMKEKDEKNS
jgi:hypothetical protein